MDAGQGSKAVAELQKAVSANHADSEAVGALGQAYSQKGDRARAVAQFEKAIALDPQSDNRGKWDSLLKVNRYWLLIQQGDAALGQRADTDFLHAIPGMSFHDDVVDVDPSTLMTAVPGIFAGGDAVTGAATVILAMGAGRTAAKAIDEYIRKR